MTAKRFIKRTFRKVRRNVCRYIVGFDNCPKSVRKNYTENFTTLVDSLLLVLIVCLIAVALVLMA